MAVPLIESISVTLQKARQMPRNIERREQ